MTDRGRGGERDSSSPPRPPAKALHELVEDKRLHEAVQDKGLRIAPPVDRGGLRR